ncbi:MAG: hypothetical protein K1060chlam5_00982 [Candidatus Anoxychlamydiales bacterium]|nr:hypothetical protein [Candidatus Anoxychlamydiales bacterium]
MLESIFGGKNIERILFYILINKSCYATQLRFVFNTSLSPFQKALDRLESGNILVSFLEGKTRIYKFNPRYPFLNELINFLKKAYEFMPDEFKTQFYEPKIRKRPRRKGKIL